MKFILVIFCISGGNFLCNFYICCYILYLVVHQNSKILQILKLSVEAGLTALATSAWGWGGGGGGGGGHRDIIAL